MDCPGKRPVCIKQAIYPSVPIIDLPHLSNPLLSFKRSPPITTTTTVKIRTYSTNSLAFVCSYSGSFSFAEQLVGESLEDGLSLMSSDLFFSLEKTVNMPWKNLLLHYGLSE